MKVYGVRNDKCIRIMLASDQAYLRSDDTGAPPWKKPDNHAKKWRGTILILEYFEKLPCHT